jgi:hypothetical protein
MPISHRRPSAKVCCARHAIFDAQARGEGALPCTSRNYRHPLGGMNVGCRPDARKPRDRRRAARSRPFFPSGLVRKRQIEQARQTFSLPCLPTPETPFHAEPAQKTGSPPEVSTCRAAAEVGHVPHAEVFGHLAQSVAARREELPHEPSPLNVDRRACHDSARPPSRPKNVVNSREIDKRSEALGIVTLTPVLPS